MSKKIASMNTKKELKLANNFFNTGDYLNAEKILKNILKADRSNAEVLYQLGLVAYKVKNINKAIDIINKAINIKASEEYYINLGSIFFEQKKFDDAIDCFEKAIETKPDCFSAYNNLGVAYEKKEMTDKAINCYKKALELNSNYAEAYCNLGVSYKNKGQIDSAIEYYLKAISINPKSAVSNYNLGIAYMIKRDIITAIKYYIEAIKMDPSYTDTYLNLGIAYLLAKNFKQGWKYYEWRFHGKRESAPKISNPKPRWKGDSLKDKIIYVYYEQGIGDTIQFVRFLPILKSLGAKKVLFKCQTGLEKLLKLGNFNIDIVDNSTNDELIEFDTYISLLSIPGVLNIEYNNIPKTTEYLKPDINKVIKYKQKFFANDKFKIGIFWQGSLEHKSDKERSIPLEYFYPLFKLSGIEIYSLQKGYGIEQLNKIPKEFNIIDLGSTFNDFSDTAAAIENLDLVITIDSAVAHLAGAMGKPVWIILPLNLEWRWFVDEKETVWYKSARLFRPEPEKSKRDLIEYICKELCEKLNCIS